MRDGDGKAARCVTYGQGLGGDRRAPAAGRSGRRQTAKPGGIDLPQINIDGATGTELATALGTRGALRRGGVTYTVLGSVPPAAAENAARDVVSA